MDMAFEGINGCKSIIDVMLVWRSSKEEHDQNLRKVPERTREVSSGMPKNVYLEQQK